MSGTVTITGDIGPGQAVSGLVLNNVSRVNIDMENTVVEVFYQTTGGQPMIQQFDVQDQNTVTVTKSGRTWAITIAA